MCARWSQNLQSIFVSALNLAPARTFVTIFNLSSAERRCCCWSTWSTHETKMKFTKRSGCVGAGAGAGSCWVLNCALINLRFMSAVLSSCWPGLEMNQRGLALFTSPDLSTLGICTHHQTITITIELHRLRFSIIVAKCSSLDTRYLYPLSPSPLSCTGSGSR